jgi:hypothetical protein
MGDKVPSDERFTNLVVENSAVVNDKLVARRTETGRLRVAADEPMPGDVLTSVDEFGNAAWAPSSVTVSGGGLEGDGTMEDPLELDIVTGRALTGAGTMTSPLALCLGVIIVDQSDPCNFQTIQEGIEEAKAQGVTLTTPKTIWIFPGVYAESIDLNGVRGLTMKGVTNGYNNGLQPGVEISGATVPITSLANVTLENLFFSVTSGNAFELGAATYEFRNCSIIAAGIGANGIRCTGATVALRLNNSLVASNGTAVFSDALVFIFDFVNNSVLDLVGVAAGPNALEITTGGGGTMRDTQVMGMIELSGPATVTCDRCTFNPGASNPAALLSNASAILNMYNSRVGLAGAPGPDFITGTAGTFIGARIVITGVPASTGVSGALTVLPAAGLYN